jgi:hypothetical protein
MKRIAAAAGLVAAALALSPSFVQAQAKAGGMKAAMSKEAMIRNAMSAAPASVSANATIMAWPTTADGEPTVLRQGTNGWVCYPDMPETKGNDPMCLDEAWQSWAKAYMSKGQPQVGHVGVAYMMAPGGASGSNTDPYATGPTADNEWGPEGPHLMIVVPDPSMLEGLPTKRGPGPYVMWRGTPYAHIMVPVSAKP